MAHITDHPVPSKELILNQLKDLHGYLVQEYRISEIRLFGSIVRGETTPHSDLDILVAFSETPDMFTFIRLEQYLTNTLGIKVDLVLKNSLKPHIGKNILSEVVYA